MGEPVPVEARLHRAVQLASLGRLADAVPIVHGVLGEQPDNVTALQVLAYCMQVEGRFEEMLATARRAVSLAPDDPGPHRQVAQAEVELGRARDGVDAAREARRLDPHDVRNELVLATVSLAAGRTAGILAAEAAVGRARRLAPEDLAVHLCDGAVRQRMGEFGRARAAYRHALSLEPDNADALRHLAALDAARHRAHPALALLGDTVQEAPTDAGVVRGATFGVQRLLWLLTGVACLPLLGVAVLVVTWRDLAGGAAGVAGALATVVLAVAGMAAFVRTRLRRLPHASRVLIRTNLFKRPVGTALLRPVSMTLGLVLLALTPRTGIGEVLVAVALALVVGPLLLLVPMAYALLITEAYLLARRLWFRLHRLRRWGLPR